jgi:hypothetical protein
MVANSRMLITAYVLPTIGARRLDRLTPSDVQNPVHGPAGIGGKTPLSEVRNVHRVLHNYVDHTVPMGEERPVYTPDQVR